MLRLKNEGLPTILSKQERLPHFVARRDGRISNRPRAGNWLLITPMSLDELRHLGIISASRADQNTRLVRVRRYGVGKTEVS